MFEVFRTVGVSGQERKVDVGRSRAGKFLFRFFSFILNTLHSGSIAFNVDTGFLLKFVD